MFLFQKYIYLLAVSIGILLHLLQDSITYQGIKNGLFPLQRFGYNFVLLPRIFRFAVGSITEKIIFIISIMFLFIGTFFTSKLDKILGFPLIYHVGMLFELVQDKH